MIIYMQLHDDTLLLRLLPRRACRSPTRALFLHLRQPLHRALVVLCGRSHVPPLGKLHVLLDANPNLGVVLTSAKDGKVNSHPTAYSALANPLLAALRPHRYASVSDCFRTPSAISAVHAPNDSPLPVKYQPLRDSSASESPFSAARVYHAILRLGSTGQPKLPYS
jgi:hypothetical protein